MPRTFGAEYEVRDNHFEMRDLERFLNQGLTRLGHSGQLLLEDEYGDGPEYSKWELKGEHCGFEFTTPILDATMANLNYVKGVLDHLRSMVRGHSIVDRSCGNHVHICVRDFDNAQLHRLVAVFRHWEHCLLMLQPRSRHNNQYCTRIANNGDLREYFNDWQTHGRVNIGRIREILYNHYCGVSFQNWEERRTIEIRYGAGTIRGSKAKNWIETLLTLVEISKNDVNSMPRLTDHAPSFEEFVQFVRNHRTNIGWMEADKERLCDWMLVRKEELNRAPAER